MTYRVAKRAPCVDRTRCYPERPSTDCFGCSRLMRMASPPAEQRRSIVIDGSAVRRGGLCGMYEPA